MGAVDVKYVCSACGKEWTEEETEGWHDDLSDLGCTRSRSGGWVGCGKRGTLELPASAIRKETPVYSGFLAFFPLAIREVARCSRIGSQQHNLGEPTHWDRSKSGDEKDALARHLLDAGKFDDDGVRHSAKVAWRAFANLEKELEAANDSG